MLPSFSTNLVFVASYRAHLNHAHDGDCPEGERGPYECDECNFSFDTEDDLAAHKTSRHVRFKAVLLLVSHILMFFSNLFTKMAQSNLRYYCTCGLKYNRKSSLDAHLSGKSNPEEHAARKGNPQ